MVRCLVIAVALAGCGDKQLEELQAVRDEVCACKTPACGEAAMKKLPQGTTKSTHAMQRVANEMLDCIAKLNDTRPTTDPDAPTGSGAAEGAGSAPGAGSGSAAGAGSAPGAGSGSAAGAGSAP